MEAVATTARPAIRRRLLPEVGTAGSVIFILALLAMSYVIPRLLPYSPTDQSLADMLKPPVPFNGSTWNHPLGTDELGRDVLARLAEGARVSLTVSLAAVAIAGTIGAIVGMVAGFRRGIVDHVVQAAVEVQVCFPGLLMAILFLALVGASIGTLIAFLSLMGWMIFARTARAGVLGQKNQEYVQSARAIGASSARVLFRHIAPALLPGLAVVMALETAQNMLAESALSFLGLGIQPPGVSWGLMMADGRQYMTSAWWLIVLPGLAIVLAVLSVMLLAETSRRKIQDR
jgi:ABC-type dipeptide/oligopeptide/nickel transport system permease subunit